MQTKTDTKRFTAVHTLCRPYPSRKKRGAGPLSLRSQLCASRAHKLDSWASLGCLRGCPWPASLSISPLILRGGRRAWCAIEDWLPDTLVSYEKHVSPPYATGKWTRGEGHHEGRRKISHTAEAAKPLPERTHPQTKKLSPLYAKGGRHGAAPPTDLATEHLHALQYGLVTHG